MKINAKKNTTSVGKKKKINKERKETQSKSFKALSLILFYFFFSFFLVATKLNNPSRTFYLQFGWQVSLRKLIVDELWMQNSVTWDTIYLKNEVLVNRANMWYEYLTLKWECIAIRAQGPRLQSVILYHGNLRLITFFELLLGLINSVHCKQVQKLLFL